MRILTLDNTVFDLDTLPEEIDDLRFAIFDNSDPNNPDHMYIPLIFLETFNSPALVLKIGDNIMKMPIDWQVLIGEEEVGDLEMLAMTSINDRGFKTFEFKREQNFRQKSQQQSGQRKTRPSVTELRKAYELIGVAENATMDEIKKAYRKLAKIHHPDKVSHLGEEHQNIAKEKFQIIVDAYDTIKEKRGV